MADETQLPLATFRADEFHPLTLDALGTALAQLCDRPLKMVALFRDARTNLPGLLLRFAGVEGVLAPVGLLVSPRPLTAHPWSTLDMAIVDGAELGQIRHLAPDAQPAQPQDQGPMAIPGDAVGELRAFSLHLGAVAASPLSGEPLTQERRVELAGLLEPVIAAVEGTIRAEVARRQGDGPKAPAQDAHGGSQ